MDKRVKFIFSGDVKGTGYRFFIKQKAIDLGLTGYCTLNSRSQLEVEVEGRTKVVDEFIHFDQKGVSLQAETNEFTLEIFKDLQGYTTMESDIV